MNKDISSLINAMSDLDRSIKLKIIKTAKRKSLMKARTEARNQVHQSMKPVKKRVISRKVNIQAGASNNKIIAQGRRINFIEYRGRMTKRGGFTATIDGNTVNFGHKSFVIRGKKSGKMIAVTRNVKRRVTPRLPVASLQGHSVAFALRNKKRRQSVNDKYYENFDQEFIRAMRFHGTRIKSKYKL